MVNFGLNSASILGIFLAVAGASLYFMRSVRPELARDHDIFFAAVGLLCGFILLFQGWRLDPILQFGQFLLTGSSIFFAVESIRLRGVATEQARRNTPIVDRDRPVSRTRVYTEAELDKIDPYENYEGTPNYNSPRLRGYEDPQPRSSRRSSSRRSDGEVRENPRVSRNRPPRYDRDANPPRRRSAPPRDRGYSEWQEPDRWDEPQERYPRSRGNERYPEAENPAPPRPRANPADWGRSYDSGYEDDRDRSSDLDYDSGLGRSYDDEDEVINTDYEDYQPGEGSSVDYEGESNSPQRRDRDADSRPRNNPIDLDY